MTRSDLVEELAARFSQLTHRDAEYAVKTILEAMGDALVRGHRIEIRGFGSFSINRRPPRMGRNPRRAPLVLVVLAAFAGGLGTGVLLMMPRWWKKHPAGRASHADDPRTETPSTSHHGI